MFLLIEVHSVVIIAAAGELSSSWRANRSLCGCSLRSMIKTETSVELSIEILDSVIEDELYRMDSCRNVSLALADHWCAGFDVSLVRLDDRC